MRTALWSGLVWMVLSAPAALSAEPPAPSEKSAPVRINSDKLRVLQKKGTALFSGHVRAEQGDLVISCQQLEVRYGSGSGSEKTALAGEIQSMIFSGDVNIEQSSRRGHCERAEYDRLAGRIVCTGKPWVVEGPNRIRGTRIVYLLKIDEVRVTKPQALIEIPDERKKKHRGTTQ